MQYKEKIYPYYVPMLILEESKMPFNICRADNFYRDLATGTK